MVNYSLEEQVIGSWIDGKPIYQKTINCGTLPNNENKSIDHNIENIDSIVSFKTCASREDGLTINIPFYDINYPTWSVRSSANKTSINLTTNENMSDYVNAYTTIQYTKTTDAENSLTPDMLSSIKMSEVVTDEDVNDVIGGI